MPFVNEAQQRLENARAKIAEREAYGPSISESLVEGFREGYETKKGKEERKLKESEAKLKAVSNIFKMGQDVAKSAGYQVKASLADKITANIIGQAQGFLEPQGGVMGVMNGQQVPVQAPAQQEMPQAPTMFQPQGSFQQPGAQQPMQAPAPMQAPPQSMQQQAPVPGEFQALGGRINETKSPKTQMEQLQQEYVIRATQGDVEGKQAVLSMIKELQGALKPGASQDTLPRERFNFQVQREQQRQLEEKQKRERENKQLEIPGYSLQGGTRPTTVEAKNARETVAGFDSMEQNVNELIDIIKNYGSFELTGPETARAEGLVTSTQLQIKDIAGLGILSESDLNLLKDLVVSPTSWGQIFVRDKTAITRLETALKTAKTTMDSKLKASGYVKAQAKDLPIGSTKLINGVTYVKTELGWKKIQ